MFSGSAFRDVSCFTFKELEEKRLGIILKWKDNNIEVQSNAIAFVNDSDFCAGGVECEIKISNT